MRIKRILTGILASVLTAALLVTDVIGAGLPATADTGAPTITLNGLVESGAPGRLSSSSIIMSSEHQTKISYRLVPNYSSGEAAGVKVRIYLPSLEHVNGEYRVVDRDAAPGAMGVQGEVRSGGGWNVLTKGKVDGGVLELELEGALGAGDNLGFELILDTYNDGTDGVYGGVPEGWRFNVHGSVSYEAFNGDESVTWETPGRHDLNSDVAAIASDLKWTPSFEAYVPEGESTAVPLWDRFQYFDYVYTLQNVSTNPASNIDGYTVTFDIDTTDNLNGIIASDINRYVYNPDGEAIFNDDPDDTDGLFVGVPDKGGVLIYDITDWDGESALTDPLPYHYGGLGLVTLDREHAEARQQLTPGQERTYLVSLPMSRQGFPNLPVNFMVDAITDILIGHDTHWSKTNTVDREVMVPTYDFEFGHTPERPEAIYGVETYTEITGMTNRSNAPVFDPSLTTTVDPDFEVDRLTATVDSSQLARFEDLTLAYTYTEENGDEVTVELPFVVAEDEANPGQSILTWDLSVLRELERQDREWNRALTLTGLGDRLNVGETIPMTVRVYGTPFREGEMVTSATATYLERYSVGENYTQATDYAHVEHSLQVDAPFEVVLPEELVPAVDVIGVYGSARTNGTTSIPFEAPLQAEYQLDLKGGITPEFTYTIDLTDGAEHAGSLVPRRIALTEALTEHASDLVIKVIDEDGKERSFRGPELTIVNGVISDGSEPAEGDPADTLGSISRVVISGTYLRLESMQTIAVVDYQSTITMGAQRTLRATFDGAQVPPYTERKVVTDTNRVDVPEAGTRVETEGVNQVTKSPGANATATPYDQWVDRLWYCSTSNCGSKTDYTLDQGYKSLGGFVTSVTRPDTVATNNTQTTVIDVSFPAEQFDMYYLKIRDDLRPFLRDITIYREVDGTEEPWKTIPVSEWQQNTVEGNFWRIATADPSGTDLFSSHEVVAGEDHPYYKDAFSAHVVPEQPVSRVEVTLEFTRENADTLPQLAGTTSRAIEFMGRFYATSEEGRKPTDTVVTDTIGVQTRIQRSHVPTKIYSLVSYPFAQSKTGAQDSTNLAKKIVPMGAEAHYLVSLQNKNTGSWYVYNGHGPDIYSPVWTEFDEWLYHYDPASFHDRMSLEFVYPDSPAANPDYHFEATEIVLPQTDALRYLTELRIDFDDDSSQTLVVDDELRAAILAQPQLRVVYDHTRDAGFSRAENGDFVVSAGADAAGDESDSESSGDPRYPTRFELFFEQVPGFGDRTAELQGVAEQTLGATLDEVDLRVGGVVNGNRELEGLTNLYREPNDTARTLMHTSRATLQGYTPTLGAAVNMNFGAMRVLDYEVDGITPQSTEVSAGLANTAQADITGFTLHVNVDNAYRTRKVTIPAAIFNGDWEVTEVVLSQTGRTVKVDRDAFTRVDDEWYVLDLNDLFVPAPAGADALEITQQTANFSTAPGETSVLEVKQITRVSVTFAAKTDANGAPLVRMWGSHARETDPTLPARMIAGDYVILTGDWVDETAAGHSWHSKPAFRNQGTYVTSGTSRNTTFVASAENMETPQRFFANAGSGNRGMKPTYTWDYGEAPYVYHRVAQMQLWGTHLTNDLLPITSGAARLYDADTDAQIGSSSMVVGDTATVLYELRNTAPNNESLPVLDPVAHFTAPNGMRITKVTPVVTGENEAVDAAIAGFGRTQVALNTDEVAVTEVTAGKRVDVTYRGVALAAQESAFILVTYEAVDDYSTAGQPGSTQKKNVDSYSYARPGYTHHLQNYNLAADGGNGVTGYSTTTSDFDGDGRNETIARVYNRYTFANPNATTVSTRFDVENVSGADMTITVSDMQNELLHDNTRAVVEVTFDTRAHGFRLSELPTPEYPEGFVGEYPAPKVQIQVGGQWVTYDPDNDAHDLAQVTKLRVDYGIVPAREGSTTGGGAGAGGAAFRLPDFTIHGKGFWQPYGGATTKSSNIRTEIVFTLTHHDGSREGNPAVAAYQVVSAVDRQVHKAMPVVELNLQSFDSRAEAEAPYTDASAAAVGKTSYLPGDDVHMKLTVRNEDAAPSANTGYGKAPLLDPVVFDKVPEYLTSEVLDPKYLTDGVLDVAAAVHDGVLKVTHFDREGNERADVQLPTATVTTVTGLDVAGAQTFNNDRHNDSFGLLSKAEPVDTEANPAREITFQVITYEFSDHLERGERIEIVSSATIRTHDLPYATYPDGRAVFAPLLGWYAQNVPLSSNAHEIDMDMAALLHDAGVSGSRSFEMQPNEFLMTSSGWQPGSTLQRRHPASTTSLHTYYDASANSLLSHRAYLRETSDNMLYEGPTSSAQDDTFALASSARVNDGTVTHTERILWAQDSLQLNRAWLYGASEVVPETQRASSGTDAANFYEFDKNLQAPTNGITPYSADDYVYAVELHEQFTLRLHAANLGDREITSGISYLEVLPIGVSPYDEQGELLGITAYAGDGTELAVTYDVIQTPEHDQGYRAPAQHQEAGHYDTRVLDDEIPYVVKIEVAGTLQGMFNDDASTMTAKQQHVDLRVRVEQESTLMVDGRFVWYDQLTVSTIDPEEYLEVYSAEYGAYHVAVNTRNPSKFPNDGMHLGIDVNDVRYAYSSSNTSHHSMEPWGMYISGINAQGTRTTLDGKPAIVTGDHVALRQPTLRVWNDIEKDSYDPRFDESLQNFTVDLYEPFTVHATVENQQVEAQVANPGNYGYPFTYQPQTTGGARGTWFDPTVTVTLPYGIVPVLEGGKPARYDGDVADQQRPQFTASLNNVTHSTSEHLRDVTEYLDVRVQRVDGGEGERFVLFFTIKNDAASREALHRVGFGQSLVVSPRVMTIDEPSFGQDVPDDEKLKYQEIITVAASERAVFTPVVTGMHQTGSVPYGPAADSARRDSTSRWQFNAKGEPTHIWGALRITEPLISATKSVEQSDDVPLHTNGRRHVTARDLLPEQVPVSEVNTGAMGGTRLALRQPTIVNDTRVGLYADSAPANTQLVDSAGKFWVSTEITNVAVGHDDPYQRILASGDLHSSRFVVNHSVTSFATRVGEPVLVVDGKVLERSAFEKLGYTVTATTAHERDGAGERQHIQWVVTTPAGDTGARGFLAAGQSVTLRHQMQLVDGFADTTDDAVWRDPSLQVDSYVSVITDDLDLAPNEQGKSQFIVQRPEVMHYEARVDEQVERVDFDHDGKQDTLFAHDNARIEIIQPAGEVRTNTSRPRIEFSNGSIGDPYFNSDDTIEYLVTLAKNTGSGLKQMVIDTMLPWHESDDPTYTTTAYELKTSLRSVTSGQWEVPQATLDRLDVVGKTVDQVFETEVLVWYVEPGTADEPGQRFEDGRWVSLGTSSVLTDTEFTVPAELQQGAHRVRVIVHSLDDDFLVPSGMRLAIDADPVTEGAQEVSDTDPKNESINSYPAGVIDPAIKMRMSAISDVKQTQFIYSKTTLLGNYVAQVMSELDDSVTRSYLTPARPVVNVFHTAEYYRVDNSRPQDERWGWSDNMAVNPSSSQHLKFRAELVNADESMWDPATEGKTYAEDLLVNPVITFELPTVLNVGGDFTYVPSDEVDESSPLHEDHRSRFGLHKEDDAFLWTWKLVRAGETDSHVQSAEIYVGPHDGLDRNVVTVWFTGEIRAGDKIVVDFIGLVDTFVPGAAANELKSKVYATNNTGLVQPLNSSWNSSNRLGYMSDRYDLDRNGVYNDRLVFAERLLFNYEVYDNFGKRKTASSDLNRAGTTHPNATEVREGGTFTYAIALDNTKEANDTPYPYPIMYDVLPHVGDTDVLQATMPRRSTDSAVLDLDSFELVREGDTPLTYKPSEYTVFVGPFTKQGSRVEVTDMITHEQAGSQAFYDSLKTPATRGAYFVTVAELKSALKTQPELIDEVRTVLVMFTKTSETLPGQSKLKLTYDMAMPLNAPAFLQRWDTEHDYTDFAQWNSFVGTQNKEGFQPQESNKAGVYVTERADRVSIGNYVWHDANFNGLQDEGESFVDGNGRTLLRPSKDLDYDGAIDDPGINEVTVTLLTPNGNYVDERGNAIAKVGDAWLAIDDESGEVRYDDLSQTTVSEGPLITTTRTDVNGFNGYYQFSNIAPGTYRVMFELPKGYERHWVTTEQVPAGAGITVVEPGVAAGVPAVSAIDALVAITEPQTVTTDTEDAVRMGFDLGVGEWFEFGGVVWNDANRDGTRAASSAAEPLLAGYTVTLVDADGQPVTDLNGVSSVTTGADGRYRFRVLPDSGRYHLRVSYPTGVDYTTMPVSPVMHAQHPFTHTDDNDAFMQQLTDDDGAVIERIVRTNEFQYDLEALHTTIFTRDTPVDAVNFGLYERTLTGVIGNRVWEDVNHNGIQDFGEPGIAGQELILDRFIYDGETWVIDASFPRTTTTSGDDGYYAFTNVAAFESNELGAAEVRYQVRVESGSLVSGYTFTKPLQGGDRQVDSDFTYRGTMGTRFISLVEGEGDDALVVDDTTIDLGLISQATGTIAGEIFIDAERDGLKTGDARADTRGDRFVATLQVSTDGETWQDVAEQRGVNAYRFEELVIFNESAGAPNQYRVVVTEVPLWLAPTTAQAGNDDRIDSDFTAVAGSTMYTATSDIYVIGELVQDEYFPINTREAIDFEHVDLGLVEPTATVGGMMWDDANHNGIQDPDEAPIVGATVTLWEEVNGEWTKVEASKNLFEWFLGLFGVESPLTQVTDAKGEYRFEVSPFHYEDEDADTFLQARTYRVTADRAGWQAWSPLHVGDDASLDSDVITPATEFGNELTGVTTVFDLVDEHAGRVLPTTVRDDLERDLGLTTFADAVQIGGRVWEDANLNGVQDDDEFGFPGQIVTLQEKIDGEWVVAEDLDGVSETTTDEYGMYRFRVQPTHFDPAHDRFLELREYRVISDRLGYQEWSPVHQGDDPTLDSNVHGAEAGETPQLRGTSDRFVVANVDGLTGWADATSFRDDLEIDLGVKTYAHTVMIGGLVWVDGNEDGDRQGIEPVMAGRVVTLQELVDGEWVKAQDVNGVSTQETLDDGSYEFEVLPTRYEEDAEGYLQLREYRTVIDVPERHRLSSAADTVTVEGGLASSQSATIAPVDEEDGRVILGAYTHDHTLNYPFVKIPLPVTGGQLAWWLLPIPVGVMLLAAGVLLLRRQRRAGAA